MAGTPLGVCIHEVLHTGQASTVAGDSRNATLLRPRRGILLLPPWQGKGAR